MMMFPESIFVFSLKGTFLKGLHNATSYTERNKLLWKDTTGPVPGDGHRVKIEDLAGFKVLGMVL
jgi:hypothetical protein